MTTGALAAAALSWAAPAIRMVDLAPALTFGLLVGAFVLRADPKWCWGAAVLLLVCTPLLLFLGARSFAEVMARTAFYLLASALVLEFRAGHPPSGPTSRDGHGTVPRWRRLRQRSSAA